MSYTAVATAESEYPLATAIASMVVFELTAMAPVYLADAVVGAVPFKV